MRRTAEIQEEIAKVAQAKATAIKKVARCEARLEELRAEKEQAKEGE